MTYALLLRYWREAAIGVLCLALIASCVERDHRLKAQGVALERTRVADSTLKVVTPELIHTDTLLVRDTVKVRLAVERVVTLRDTVLKHLTDTLLVKEFVTRADSAAQACTELSQDCARFRVLANESIAAWKAKALVAPQIVVKSCVAPSVLSAAIGLGVGYLVHREKH